MFIEYKQNCGIFRIDRALKSVDNSNEKLKKKSKTRFQPINGNIY